MQKRNKLVTLKVETLNSKISIQPIRKMVKSQTPETITSVVEKKNL